LSSYERSDLRKIGPRGRANVVIRSGAGENSTEETEKDFVGQRSPGGGEERKERSRGGGGESVGRTSHTGNS